MGRWIKKPHEVEAWKWNFSPDQEKDPKWVLDALGKWPAVGGIAFEPDHANGPRICVATLDAVAVLSPGDYLVKGIHGELYPCKPDIFEELHTRVD